MTKLALLLSVAAMSLGWHPRVAAADEVPTFEVNSICRGEASTDPDAGAMASCMADEKAARETLVKDWATFAANAKTSCTQEQTGGPVQSYVELLTCLQMARDLRGLRKE